MKALKSTILSCALGICAFIPAAAQDLESLNYPSNARSFAMGGTDMAMNAYGTTIMSNPAAMALSENKFSIQGNYMGIQPSSLRNHFDLAAYYSINQRFAVSLYGQGSLERRRTEFDGTGNPLGDFTPYSYTVGAGFAAEILDGFAIGLNAKVIGAVRMSNEYIELNPGYKNACAFAADLSLMYTTRGVRISAGLSNIGTKIKYSNSEKYTGYDLPTAVRVGLGYGKQWGRHTLDAGLQADYLIFASEYYGGVGAEYGFDDMLFIRGGYHYNGNSINCLPQYASVGLGIKFIGISIDAAYMIPVGNSSSFNGYENSFMISLGWEF